MSDAKKGIPAIGGAAALAAKAATGQKKKNPGKVRMYQGKVIRPVLYNGRAIGQGLFYGGHIVDPSQRDATAWDLMVKDENGVPVPLDQIGELVAA